jgi:hypothetical protein
MMIKLADVWQREVILHVAFILTHETLLWKQYTFFKKILAVMK